MRYRACRATWDCWLDEFRWRGYRRSSAIVCTRAIARLVVVGVVSLVRAVRPVRVVSLMMGRLVVWVVRAVRPMKVVSLLLAL